MKKLIIFLLLSSICSYSLADEIVTLKSGEKAILLDSGRWSIMSPRGTKEPQTDKEGNRGDVKLDKIKADTYKEIQLITLKQDINAFQGQQVKVQAAAEMYNFILMLRKNEMDESPVSVNINKLSHEERNNLEAECNDGCIVMVYGRVGDILHDEKGIIADKIEW